MILHKCDVYTVTISEGEDFRGLCFWPYIRWANNIEAGPLARSMQRAKKWAAFQVCKRLGRAAEEIAAVVDEDVLKW